MRRYMNQEKVEDYVGHEDKWGNVGDFADKLAPGTRGEEEFGKVTRGHHFYKWHSWIVVSDSSLAHILWGFPVFV